MTIDLTNMLDRKLSQNTRNGFSEHKDFIIFSGEHGATLPKLLVPMAFALFVGH